MKNPLSTLPPEAAAELIRRKPRLKDIVSLPPVNSKPRIALPCVYIGEDSGPKGWHYCEHPETPLGDIVCACKGCGQKCPGYKVDSLRELPKNLTKNLLFHLHPIPGRWEWHRDKLLERASLFNGRKIIAVNVADTLEQPSVIKQAFPDFEVIEVKSNPTLREIASFLPLFSKLTSKEDEITLYAQSKGITHQPDSPCWRWAEILYETLIDYPDVIENLLKEYPICGSFKKVGRGFKESKSDWHYSGSWFWFRNKELYDKEWQRHDRFWSGIETYPSVHFTADQAGVVFHEGTVPNLNLYSWQYLSKTVEPAYGQWKMSNVKTLNKEPCQYGKFWDWLASQSKPRVLEIGTKGWDGKPPKHHKKAVLEVSKEAEWVGTDYLEGEGVDIVADVHELSKHFKQEFDAIICISSLEHFIKPWLAIEEIKKVLKPGGLCLIQTHQTFPIHGYPNDYFRFTDSAIRVLFEGWEEVELVYEYPCKIIPDIPPKDWNTLAESYLNIKGVFKRI
jgi:SAM-dependent methyltransferase